MNELADLESQVRAKLATVQSMQAEQQARLEQEMAEFDRRLEHFNRVADELMASVVRPRLETVAKLFPNAEPQKADGLRGRHCGYTFQRTDLFPATTQLDVSICPDERSENVLVNYALEILPIFFQFNGHDQMCMAMDAINASQVAEWVDAKLLEFVDTYLRVPTVEAYHQGNLVTDPVCAMRINRSSTTLQSEYNGETYYFCSDGCRRKFEESPSHFVGRKRV